MCALSKNLAACQLLEDLKTGSSAWVKTLADDLRAFSWQRGYSIFSVSPSLVPTVARYIDNQEEHHKKVSFEDEFRAFLKRHGIAFDERYVWD